MTIVIVLISSIAILRFLVFELRTYDKDIFSQKYLQIRRIITFLVPALLIASLPKLLSNLRNSGYVPISKFDFTTPIFGATVIFLYWLLRDKGEDTDYKPIFKVDKD